MIVLQKYMFQAKDLQVLGHLGEGAFGTVTKMYFKEADTEMAVKVCTTHLLTFLPTN